MALPAVCDGSARWRARMAERFYELCVSRAIECAHYIEQGDGDDDPRKAVHGHSYICSVCVQGGDLGANGTLIDADQLRTALDQVCTSLDHRLLNDIEGLSAATMEALSRYIFDAISALGYAVGEVRIERPTLGYQSRFVARQ